jgi:hypothetical protein
MSIQSTSAICALMGSKLIVALNWSLGFLYWNPATASISRKSTVCVFARNLLHDLITKRRRTQNRSLLSPPRRRVNRKPMGWIISLWVEAYIHLGYTVHRAERTTRRPTIRSHIGDMIFIIGWEAHMTMPLFLLLGVE